MRIKINELIITIAIFIFGGLIWLWSDISGFTYEYVKKVEISFSFIGAIVGGASTLIALYITVNETRKIQDENRNQLFISNINEEIKDYSTLLIGIKKNCTSLQKYMLAKDDIIKVKGKLMEFLELRDNCSLVTSMYLSEEIAIKTKEIDNLYTVTLLRGYDVLNCAKDEKEYTNEMLVFYQHINDIISKFVELSLQIDECMKMLYEKKYKNLHNKLNIKE